MLSVNKYSIANCLPFWTSLRSNLGLNTGSCRGSTLRDGSEGGLILFFASLFAIPLASQRCLHAALFAWFQIVGVTLHFLDDVLLLNFALEPAQRIFKRLAFLNANLCQ
ncbi:MAG TPA: hypothetical protein VMD55_14105 [Terracidiphilus sp.]|nr:hypothetical protein [Terracidiphilus sp.]